jgi:hypothetical protein
MGPDVDGRGFGMALRTETKKYLYRFEEQTPKRNFSKADREADVMTENFRPGF